MKLETAAQKTDALDNRSYRWASNRLADRTGLNDKRKYVMRASALGSSRVM